MRSQRKSNQGVATRRHTTLTLMDALDKARLSLHRNVTATDDELEETWETVKEKMAEVIRIAFRLRIGGRLKFELGIDSGEGQGTRTIDNTDELIDAYEMLSSCDDSTAFIDAWLDFGDGEPIDLDVAMTKQQLSDRMGRAQIAIRSDEKESGSNQVKLETSGRYVKLTQREREIIDRLCEEELDQMRDDVEIDVGYMLELGVITGKVRQASTSQTDQERSHER